MRRTIGVGLALFAAHGLACGGNHDYAPIANADGDAAATEGQDAGGDDGSSSPSIVADGGAGDADVVASDATEGAQDASDGASGDAAALASPAPTALVASQDRVDEVALTWTAPAPARRRARTSSSVTGP